MDTPRGARGERSPKQQRFDAVVTSGPPHSATLPDELRPCFETNQLFVDLREPALSEKRTMGHAGITSAWRGRYMSVLQRWLFLGSAV